LKLTWRLLTASWYNFALSSS